MKMIAAILAMALLGCKVEGSLRTEEPPAPPAETYEAQSFFGHVEVVTLRDGRRCVLVDGDGWGGVDCYMEGWP
jgi:hypothetical protein